MLKQNETKEGKQSRPVKRNSFINFISINTISFISLAVFILLWEFVCRVGLVSPHILVPPSEIVGTFIYKLSNVDPDGATLIQHIKTSLRLALTGFSCAVAIGVPLGLLMGWYKPFDTIIRPIFDLIRPIPPIAWIPLSILWLGIGIQAKTFIIFLAAFVPSTINSYTGIRLTDPVLVRVARIYGASNWKTFLKIGVPSAVPMVFTGLKLSLNSSWTTLVAAELLAASQGLGFLIQMGRKLARPDIIIVGMLTIGLTGALMAAILTKVESKIASSRRF
ncbi:ABC transporter permease [Desulfitobacterium sp. AusDCA]|uniref:ABC transporter permease n=1 Tax=Desulfitobacterium sp. AusDCA TaxID=3240383 RepID=UPI003DA6DA31